MEVPDEVADAIVEESRAEDANDAKQHYHCYSLDASPGMENYFPEQAASPEDILMEKETGREQEAARALMMERLREALATLTPPAGELPSCPVLGGQALQGDCRGRGLYHIGGHCHGTQRHHQVAEILYQARLDEAAKGESDMHKDSTAQAKQKKDEREEVLKEIRQLENRQKILENKQRNEERKAPHPPPD